MPLRPPQQARSRRTLERIERAAIELISAGGIDAASVQRITKRAKSSVGAFYARFAGKDELVLHLHHRLWADVRGRWDAAFMTDEEAELHATLTHLAGALFDAFEPDSRARRLIAAKLEAGEGVPPGPSPDPTEESSARPSHATLEHILVGASSRLTGHEGSLSHPAAATGVDLLLRTWLAAVPSFAEARMGRTGRPLRDIVVPELARMGRSYLAGAAPNGEPGPPEGDSPAQIEFFEVWG